jgi:phosphonate transport system substrate-binding protein
MKKWFTLIMITILMLSLAACNQKEDSKSSETKTGTAKEVFKIGAIPDQNAAFLDTGMNAAAKYLSEKTGMKVEFVPSVDYAALVTAFQRGEIQLAWFGGLTSVQAMSLAPGAEAIVQRPMDAEFHSVFITLANSGIHSLQDLKGKSFTFGSESSTSGHLMPRYYLTKAGINPDKDFDGKPNFSGSHDTTIKLIESGAFKAGALNESVWKKTVADGKVDTNKVKVFYTTPSFYDYNWTINSNIDETYGKGMKQKVKEALLSITSEQKEITELFQTDKFIETKNSNYKKIEKVARQLKIIK